MSASGDGGTAAADRPSPGGVLEVVAPFWLDRPDEEAVEIAVQALRRGFATMWIGEMASFDAFALATAVGLRAPGLGLKIGPLAFAVRSPVGLALGLASVASLTGARVDLALGASSPEIVAGWHDRSWQALAPRARETIEAVRSILAGTRTTYDGEHVRVRGFRLRRPQPEARIALAAFGPAMTRVAASSADEIVLNLVTPEHVAEVSRLVASEAKTSGRMPPPITVWVAAALDPGQAAFAQLAGQISVYLKPPGYGEMFTALGFGSLVERARAGARRGELLTQVPREMVEQVCAVGSQGELARRLERYIEAGAARLGVVPVTAEDPAGRRVLSALAPVRPEAAAA